MLNMQDYTEDDSRNLEGQGVSSRSVSHGDSRYSSFPKFQPILLQLTQHQAANILVNLGQSEMNSEGFRISRAHPLSDRSLTYYPSYFLYDRSTSSSQMGHCLQTPDLM